MADYCPFCHKVVAPKDPEKVVINNSMTVCHGDCLDKAIKAADSKQFKRQKRP